MTKPNETNQIQEGVVYLSSVGGVYQATKYDAAALKKYSKNVYGAGIAEKLRNLIFQEKYTIEVLNPQGEPDQKVSQRLTLMCDQESVKLWNAIRQAWTDIFWFGASLYNPVWGYLGNEYILQKLRHLPAESFGTQPAERPIQFSEILKGVVQQITTCPRCNGEKRVDGQVCPECKGTGSITTIECWQTLNPTDQVSFPQGDLSMANIQKRLTNVFMVKNPVSAELAGAPLALPIIPLLVMLDFTWQAQMQKVNRIGAPIFFLKITNPKKDDLIYGQNLLRNWGKNTSYQLRQNFELIIPDLKDNSSNEATIEALSRMVIDYFSPVSFLNRSGTSPMSGSSMAEQELLYAYVRGVHEWISDAFNPLLQEYLDDNAYTGYIARIVIPSPSIDKSEIWLKQATEGARNGSLTTNEIRSLLEMDELDEQGLSDLRADVAARQPTPAAQTTEVVQADMALRSMAADRLDPYWAVNRKTGKRLVQTVLGIEEGSSDDAEK